MALDDTDRRRFLWVAIATLIALPALWLVSRDDGSGAPNVATADVDLGQDNGSSTEPDDTSSQQSNLPIDPPLSETPPVFLGGPSGVPGAGLAEVAVPAPGGVALQTTATYRRDAVDVTTCIVGGVATGSRLTVVNLSNNRSITCTARLAPADQKTGLVMHTDAFLQLADLTDAPIPVEIRQ